MSLPQRKKNLLPSLDSIDKNENNIENLTDNNDLEEFSLIETEMLTDDDFIEENNLEKNKEKEWELALHCNEIHKASDVVKDPYVFEFLGIPGEAAIMESDLEKALITHIEKFLLELGKGFMYVGSQQRVTLGNTHYYVDMVFYNKILRSYVLIELKTGKLMPEAVGQINMYLNYYKMEINDDTDNEPIGIILCTDKDNIQAEYALGNLSNQIFASRYTLYIPNREDLEEQVERVLKNYERK